MFSKTSITAWSGGNNKHIGTYMTELDRIREQIKRMRVKGIEPEVVYLCYDLWHELGKPRRFAGVECCESDRILGRFEVR